jgi:hypothetical protein
MKFLSYYQASCRQQTCVQEIIAPTITLRSQVKKNIKSESEISKIELYKALKDGTHEVLEIERELLLPLKRRQSERWLKC